jgi:hypothetical protein
MNSCVCNHLAGMLLGQGDFLVRQSMEGLFFPIERNYCLSPKMKRVYIVTNACERRRGSCETRKGGVMVRGCFCGFSCHQTAEVGVHYSTATSLLFVGNPQPLHSLLGQDPGCRAIPPPRQAFRHNSARSRSTPPPAASSRNEPSGTLFGSVMV